MQATCLIWAFARLDSQEKWVAVVVASSPEPIPAKVVVDRLGPTSGHITVQRAIKRLLRDQVIAVVRGLLQIADPRSWPAHRVNADDLVRLEQLVGSICGDDQTAMVATPKEHPTIALAHETARRRAEKNFPTPKLHQAPVDDTPLDLDLGWLDEPDVLPEDPVATISKPKPITDHLTASSHTGHVCSSCENAKRCLATPGDTFQGWAQSHLNSCRWAKAATRADK